MPTAEFTDPRLNGYSTAERGIDHVANSWVPPTAPTEPSTDDDTFLGGQAFGTTPWDEKLGPISKQGDRYLRRILVVGAIAVLRYAKQNPEKYPWLRKLLALRPLQA